MAHSGSGGGPIVIRATRPRTVARVSRRLGFALVGTAGPALIAVFLVALAGGSVTDPVDWIAGALSTPLVGETGTEWAFHVAVVTALAGVWVVGLALVVEGYFGVE